MKESLSETLSQQNMVHVYNSYDIIGDVAIIRLTNVSPQYSKKIAGVIMDVHKNVKTVFGQTSAIHGDFRLRGLEYLAGKNRTVTVHKESGCSFSVDLEKCYFSPRLFHERMRIARQVGKGEVVVNMFAGVGCFSILIAKHSGADKVFSIDLNPAAIQYMRENIRVNGAYGRVTPILGDAKEVVKRRLRHVADRVLMPLPEKALEYLPYALLALKKTGGWIHYYNFEHASKDENVVRKVELKVSDELRNLDITFDIPFGRVIRATGPRWYQVVLDIKVGSQQEHLTIQ